MDGEPRKGIDWAQVLEVTVRLLPIAVIFYLSNKDAINMRAAALRRYFDPDLTGESEALRQVQKEISLMEHGGLDAD